MLGVVCFRDTLAKLCSHVQWVLQKDSPPQELLTSERHTKYTVSVLSIVDVFFFFSFCPVARF